MPEYGNDIVVFTPFDQMDEDERSHMRHLLAFNFNETKKRRPELRLGNDFSITTGADKLGMFHLVGWRAEVES